MSSRPRWTLALALAAGCADFDPYGRLTALRVLAVQSEPVAPAADETTTLTPLVYAAPGDEITATQWSWCPFPGPAADGYPCLITEADLARLAGDDAADIPPFDLGTGATATLTNTVSPRLLDALCTGVAGQPAAVDCTGGFPVQIRLRVTTGADEVIAVRRLRLRRAGDEANANPRIDGLGARDGSGGEQSLTEDAAVTLPRAVETTVHAEVAAAMAERYATTDLDGHPVMRLERLTFSWFVESGETTPGRTTFIDGIEPFDEALQVAWKPADVADYARDTSRLLVVVRDDRDGVAWRTATVRLGGAP